MGATSQFVAMGGSLTTSLPRSRIAKNGLLRQDHSEIAEHREQHARNRIADGETDPRYIGLDFHRCLPARPAVAARASDGTHKYGGVHFEYVEPDGPDYD